MILYSKGTSSLSVLLLMTVLCSASVIVKKPLKCEVLNMDTCDHNGDTECLPSVQECEEQDPDKPMHCFVVWKPDEATGMWGHLDYHQAMWAHFIITDCDRVDSSVWR